jgi:predicted DNA-binding antitoxin AbrB/MazE fold protein
MTTQCTAVYEEGRLRPSVPLALEEGERVEVIIIQTEGAQPGVNPAELLASIAALPTNGGDPNTGRDHDTVLYGKQGAR